MNDVCPNDLSSAYTELKAQMRARFQPASRTEEDLVEQIVLCQYTLERIERRLSKTWEQLDRIPKEL